MNVQKETLVVALLAVLVLIAAVQAFQLMGLNGKTVSSVTSQIPAAGNAPDGASGTTPQLNLQDLPNMVGGC